MKEPEELTINSSYYRHDNTTSKQRVTGVQADGYDILAFPGRMPCYTARKASQSTVPTKQTETRSYNVQVATRLRTYQRTPNPYTYKLSRPCQLNEQPYCCSHVINSDGFHVGTMDNRELCYLEIN